MKNLGYAAGRRVAAGRWRVIAGAFLQRNRMRGGSACRTVRIGSMAMKRIHVLGRKNHGKTTLVVELVEHLSARGLRVGTIKHTHHSHELDAPGKDSHRHRQAGASVVGILSRGMSAVFWAPAAEAASEDRYEQFAPHFAGCDLVIVEGDTMAAGPKVEVWRQAVGSTPMAREDASIMAVISDDDPQVRAPAWPRKDVSVVADEILKLLQI
jgi:molybdopterin-guanine dinucleotide biosynthesis protein MobB